jgi:stalled ribosome rescue protein Dom34
MTTVVLIDHHRARFFESAGGQHHVEERGPLDPKDPHGFERHLEHRKEAHFKGERVPEATEFYERIAERLAERLKDAGSIILIGDATGKSSAMLYLTEYLKKKHNDIADRIIATSRADLSSITLAEIEQIAT